MGYRDVLTFIGYIVSLYLLCTIPFVSALNINIYWNGILQETVSYNPYDLIKKEFQIEDNDLKIILTNSTSFSKINRVYIYKCKDKKPAECISLEPDIFDSDDVQVVYSWDDISVANRANIMIIVNVLYKDKSVWSGFFREIEKTNGEFHQYEYPLDEVDIHVKNVEDAQSVKKFIENHQTIPFSPEWVTKIAFPSIVTKLYELGSDTGGIETPLFVSKERAGNEETEIDKDYYLIFPEFYSDGITGIENPVTLYLNPLYTCDNQKCEDDLGEEQAVCGCFDCGCPDGQYCDVSYGCRLLNMIKLSLYSAPVTTISNCYEEHKITVSVKIENPPTGFEIIEKKARLGEDEESISCEESSGIYVCDIIVHPVPECNEGSFRIGPNSIIFKIRFKDAHDTREMEISTEFPDITVSSFDCGNGRCEENLGESSENCCYDCGCEEGFCDAASWDVRGVCRPDIGNENLNILNVHPLHFYTYPGEGINFEVQITDKPKTLKVEDWKCSLKCSNKEECSADCSVVCNEEPSDVSTIYNASCKMTVNIHEYDQRKTYQIYPVLNVTVRYVNGSYGTVTKELSKSFTTITFGSHWCGNGHCDPDESSENCCYDCGCEEGYYCDTRYIEYPTQGDRCKLEDFDVVIDSIEPKGNPIELVDTYKEHIIDLRGHFTHKPSGLKLIPTCRFSDGEIACYVSCENLQGNDFHCEIVIPSFDYTSSSHYDSEKKAIEFHGNFLNLSYSYHDGPHQRVKEFQTLLPDIRIKVVYECGNERCEEELGESPENCCVDCPCEKKYGKNYFCYTGETPHGKCISVNDVVLKINSFDPDPYTCIISEKGGECIFSESAKVNAEIINPPEDLKILDSYYIVDGSEKNDISCFEKNHGSYTCYFVVEDIKNSNEGSETKTFSLYLTVGYTLDGNKIVQNLSVSKPLHIERKKSEALKTCEEEERDLEDKINELEGKKRLYTALFAAFLAATMGFYGVCFAKCCTPKGCPGCKPGCGGWYYIAFKTGIVVTSCGSAYLLNAIRNVKDEIDALKERKNSLCESRDYESLSSSVAPGSMGNIWYKLGSIIAGAVCAWSVFSIIPGLIGRVLGTVTSAGAKANE